jgi:hypothetical protein
VASNIAEGKGKRGEEAVSGEEKGVWVQKIICMVLGRGET